MINVKKKFVKARNVSSNAHILMFLKSFIGWMPPKLDKAKRDLGGEKPAAFINYYDTPFYPFSPPLWSSLNADCIDEILCVTTHIIRS